MTAEEQDIVPAELVLTTVTSASARRDAKNHLLPEEKQALIRDLASDLYTRADLARRYGISRPTVTQFAERNAKAIEVARRVIQTPMSSLWIAQKELRVAAMQDDYERSKASEYADHFKQVTARQQIADSISEQLGQTPPRQQIVVQPAVYILQVEGMSGEDIEKMIT